MRNCKEDGSTKYKKMERGRKLLYLYYIQPLVERWEETRGWGKREPVCGNSKNIVNCPLIIGPQAYSKVEDRQRSILIRG